MNEAMIRKAMSVGLMGGLFEGRDSNSSGIMDGDDFDLGGMMSRIGVDAKVSYKHPKHIQADVTVVGEKAKREAQFKCFSVVTQAMYQKMAEKDDELKAAEKQAEADRESIQSLKEDCQFRDNRISGLKAELRCLNDILGARNETLQDRNRIVGDALKAFYKAMDKSGVQVRQRFQPVFDALNGNGATEE